MLARKIIALAVSLGNEMLLFEPVFASPRLEEMNDEITWVQSTIFSRILITKLLNSGILQNLYSVVFCFLVAAALPLSFTRV